MIRKLKHIFLLYLREPGFMVLCTLSFFSLCAMQALIYWGIEKNLIRQPAISLTIAEHKYLDILVQKYMLGEELLTLVFILGLWLMFSFGLLIKRQFANDRASLLPGYRRAHTISVLVILLFMVTTMVLLSYGAMTLAKIFCLQVLGVSVNYASIYLVVFFMGLSMLYLGYLSMGYFVVAGYIVLVFIGQNMISLLQIFSSYRLAFDIALISVGALFFLFIRRLLTLKNEHFEYPFLLVWPPQKTLRNQAALEEKANRFKARCLKVFRIPTIKTAIIPYYKQRQLWARAHNWGSVGQPNIYSLLLLSLALLPLYLIFLRLPTAELIVNAKAETNFLLLGTAAVLLTAITNYKNMIFWDFDLIKPVRRSDFFKEQGIKFIGNLCVYWLIIAVYFGFVPDWVSGAKQIYQPHFWAFVFLTFSFSIFCFSWLATLSAMKDERAVVGNGLVLCVLIIAEFYWGSKNPTSWLIVNALLCLTLAGLFLKLAFEKWMDVEF